MTKYEVWRKLDHNWILLEDFDSLDLAKKYASIYDNTEIYSNIDGKRKKGW